MFTADEACGRLRERFVGGDETFAGGEGDARRTCTLSLLEISMARQIRGVTSGLAMLLLLCAAPARSTMVLLASGAVMAVRRKRRSAAKSQATYRY